MKNKRIKTMALILFICIGLGTLFAGNVTFFGPKQYTRNKGKPVTETDTFACLPNYTGTGFTLRLINGDSQGNNRVSGAVIKFNGVQMMGPADFNQQVGLIERTVDLNVSNEISVKLNSKPGSYVIIDVFKYIPKPGVTFTANPGTIQYLQSSTLNWNVIYADSISIDNGIGNVEPIGSTQVSPGVPTTTYTLTAVNLGGTTTRQVTVNVIFPVPTVTFSASPLIIQPGASSTLTWTTFAAHTVTIDPGIGNVELNGSRTVTPADTTAYTITALGYGGTQTAAAAVTIDGTPPQINVTEPLDGSYLNSPNVLVKGQVVDSSPVTLKVNGNDVPLQQENYFEVPLQMNEGANTISLEAVDAAGNSFTRQVQVVVDTIAPQVQITAPQDSAFLNTPVITVTGTLMDANPDRVILNNSLEGVIDGNTFNISNVQLNEGANTLSVEAVDKAGNRSQASVSCTLDTALPVIAITEPANNSYFNTSLIWVRGTVRDSSPLTVKVNGNNVPLQGDNFETRVSLTEGQNIINVEAVDAAGNQSQSPVTCILDTELPVITISEPVNDSYFNTSSIWVKGTVRDSSPLTVKVNGNDVLLQGDNFETQVSLTEGQNTINVEVVDAAGNQSQASVTCTLDTASPVIHITSPQDNTTFNEIPITITGTVTEANLLKVVLNNQDQAAIDGNTFTFSHVNLSEGENLLTITAGDKAGNTGSASITVTYIPDTDPPEIIITSPQDGVFQNNPELTVSGTVTDQSAIAYVKVNGANAVVEGQTYTATLTLSEGENTITVEAGDQYQNKQSGSVTVMLDTVLPQVIVTQPEPGTYLNTLQVVVKGEATDASPVTVKINGSPVSFQDNQFETTLALAEGANQVKIAAEDAAGNKSSEDLEIFVDTTVPTITVSSPQENTITNKDKITITGTITDENPFKITLAGTNTGGEIIGNHFYFRDIPLQEGENALEFLAEDRAGNTNQLQYGITIIKDTVIPQLTTLSPVTGSLISQRSILVTGTVSDDHLKGVKINNNNCEIVNNEFNLVVNLVENMNTIDITASDTAGNVKTETVIIHVDTYSPLININTPQNNAILNTPTIPVSGRADDVNLSAVTINGQNASLSDNEFTLNSLSLQEGENQVIIEAKDDTGKTSIQTLKVTLDTAVPEITAVIPADQTTGVPLSSEIRVEFSETIDEAALSDQTFYLEKEGQKLDGFITPGENRVVFNAVGMLPDNAEIRIYVAAGIKDKAGNPLQNPYTGVFFTRDTTPPAPPQVELLPEKTSLKKITLNGTAEIGTNISVSGGFNRVDSVCDDQGSFSIEVPLKQGQLNQLCVTVIDAPGNQSIPTCISIYQEKSEFAVLDVQFENNEIRVTFSKPIDTTTLTSDNFIVSSANGPESGTISTTGGGTQGIFSPSNDLTSQPIMVEVKTGVTDTEGIPLSYPFAKVFNQQGGEVIAQGEVYDDLTGLPLGGAIVKLVSVDGSAPPEPAPTAITTKEGKYVIILPPGQNILGITKEGYGYSNRVVLSAAGFSSSVFDSRVTPVNAEEKTLLPEGGSLSTGGAVLVYPDGAVDVEKTVRITAVGPQSLQGRLPSGWSPLAAFDLRIPGSSQGGSGLLKPCQIRTANQWPGVSASSLILAHWDETAHQWKAVSGVSVSAEDITGTIETPGQYTFLIKDTAPAAPPQPVIGEPIPAVQQGSVPTQITAALDFDPALIYPGDTSSAVLTITSTSAISSGVPVQAKVNENYELLAGSTAAFVPYTADLTAYNYGKPDTKVEFNLSPNSAISLSELKIGTIKADMVRYGAGGLGVVVGPDGGTVSGDGGAEILIRQGSVNNPIAVTIKKLEEIELTAQVPPGFELIGALDLSLGGAALLKTAIISLSLTQEQIDNIPTDAQLFTLRLEKLDYELFWILKSRGLVENSSIKSFIDVNNNLPFPGVTEGGIYLFLRALSPTGFITGTVLEDTQPLARAMVSVDNHEIRAISSSSGNYVQTGFTGSVELTAQNQTTQDQGTGTAEIQAAGEIFPLDITIQKTGPEIAAITPVNDETGVPLNSKITFVFSEQVNASTFNSQTVNIRKGTEQVEGVFKLSTDGKQGEFTPNEDFPSNSTINIIVTTGLQDIHANGMSQEFTSRFTTVDIIPPEADLSKIKVLIPENGNAKVTGEPGSVEPGTKVIVYNERTGVAVLVDGEEDGSFTANIGAELSDKLKITVIDPAGNETVFDNKPFVSADGRRMVVDSSGGEFISPEGLGIKIEAGTFAGHVNVGIYEETDPAILAPVPEGFEALKAIRVDLSGYTPAKAFKLSIPLPAGVPGDAEVFFAREVNVFGEKKLMVVDTTSIENNRIETNSPPFLGCTAAGVYRVIWNRFLQLGFGTGRVMRPDVVVTAGEFVWICGGHTLNFIMPVYIGKDVTLTVKDINTGVTLYEKTSPGLTMMGQVYDFGGLENENDMEPPYLIRSLGIKSFSFDVTDRKITSGDITVTPDNPGGWVGSITIDGAANTTVADGKVLIYRLSGRLIGQAATEYETYGNNDGSFKAIIPANSGDRIFMTVEEDNIPIDQEFVLSFSEPIKDPEGSIKLKEIDGWEEKDVLIFPERLPSQTEVLIRPQNKLKDDTRYKFEITGISDQSNIDSNKLSFAAYFRTFRSSRTDLVIDLKTVYGSVRYGSYLYVASGDYGINILDVSNPSDIKNIRNFQDSGTRVRALALYNRPGQKKKLVVVGGGYQFNGYLSIFDLSDPENPQEEKFMFISRTRTSSRQLPEGKPRNIAIIGNYAFVPIFGSGLQVIDLLKLLNGSAHDDCRIGFYMAQGAQEVRAYKKPATEYEPEKVIAVLLEDRYGVHIIDFTNAQMPIPIGNYLFGSSTRSGSLELAMDYPVDLNEDKKYDENEKKDLLFFSMIPHSYVFVVDITDVVEKQPVDLSDYLIKKIKIDEQSADYVYNMDINAEDKTLAVTDSNNGLMLLDMSLAIPEYPTQDDIIDDTLDRVMVKTGPRGTISSQGLIWDKNLNMAYLGQSSGKIEAIKLGNPKIRLVYDDVDGKLIEVEKIAPLGIKDDDDPGQLPKEIYVMATFPGGVRNTIYADLCSLNHEGGYIIPRGNNLKTYIKNLALTRQASDKTEETFNLYLSAPITVTVNARETDGVNKLLSGDWIYAGLSKIFGTEAEAKSFTYLEPSTYSSISDKKMSVRVELIDRVENLAGTKESEIAAIPVTNPSLYSNILLHSGEKLLDEVDLHIPGRGFDFIFSRHYQSKCTYSGPVGRKWDHNYNCRLLELPGGDILYFDGKGGRDRFLKGNDVLYTPPRGRFTEFKKVWDGTFILKLSNGVIKYFDSFGRLIKIQDRNTNKIEFYYNLAGQLESVMDTMGRIIVFEYYDNDPQQVDGSSGRLKSISEFFLRKVDYTYDDVTGDLIRVDTPEGTYTYTYSDHNVLTGSDPYGNALNVTYTNNQVNTQTMNGSTVQINYGQTTTVTDAENNKTEFTHNEYGNPLTVKEVTTEDTVNEGYTTIYTYENNPDGLIGTVTYPGGNSISYSYYTGTGQSKLFNGNIRDVTQNADTARGVDPGAFPSIEIIFGQKGDVNDPTTMSFSNGFTISHDLDGFKNVRKITSNVPDLNYQYNYSDLGQLEKVTDPMGLITTYEYYSESAPGGGTQSTGGRVLNTRTGGYLKYIQNPFFTEHFDKYDERGNVTEYRNEKIDSLGDNREIKASYTYHPKFNKIQNESVRAEGSAMGSSLNYNAEYYYFENNGNLEWKKITYGTGINTITNKFTYTYWEGKNLVKTVEVEGQKDSTTYSLGTTTYYYKNNNNIWKIEGPEGKIVYSYNQRNLVSGITAGEGDEAGTYHFTYDGNGNRTSITDPKGNVTTYEYDGFDRLRKIIDPDPFKTETVIERQESDDLKVNTIVRRKDSGQNILQEYRSENDPVNRTNTHTIVDPGGEIPTYTSTYTYQYHSSHIGGETITITDSLGRQSTIIKNKNGKVVEEVDFAGNKNEYQYENGNIIKKIEHEKKEDGTFETYTTGYKYNAFDQVEEIKEYNGQLAEPLTTIFIYNDMGKLNDIHDSEGNTTTIDYDAFGRKAKTKKHMKKTGEIIETEFEYYNNNLLKSINDAKGNITEYKYVSQNRLSKIIYFDGTEIKYEYDLNGNVHKVTQRNLTEVTNTHDQLNRLTNTTIQYNDGSTASESYGYDNLSRLIRAENNDSVVNMQYDVFNRITEETRDGKAVTYNYENLSGNNILRQTITYPGQQQQKVVERTFDILNRISEIKEGSSTITSMTHIGKSFRLSKKQYVNGDTVNFLYDRGRRLSDLGVRDKNSNIILKYAYGHNQVNMKTVEQRAHDNNKGDLFEYDSIYRLTNFKINVPDPIDGKDSGGSYILKDFSDPNQLPQFEKEKTIKFDKVDNIKRLITTEGTETTEIIPTIEGNHAKLNQYTTFNQWGLDYDANGNTIQKGTQHFVYNYRNQLISATEGTQTVNYKYDALGRRIEKSFGTNTIKYYYSGNQVIEERDGSDNVLKQYIYGNGIDEIIRMDRNENGTMVPYYYHTNSIGSVTAITDQNGNLVERINYDIYGMPTFTDFKTDPQNPQVVENSVIGNDILFQGRRYDKETNLYYFRTRYYDPIMGRFLSVDPMGYEDSMNLYQAFNLNPVNFIDPMGKMYEEVIVTPQGARKGPGMNVAKYYDLLISSGLSIDEALDMIEQSPSYSRYYHDGSLIERIKAYYRDTSYGILDYAKDVGLKSVDDFMYETSKPLLMIAVGHLNQDVGYIAGGTGALLFEALGAKAIGYFGKKAGKYLLKKFAPKLLKKLTKQSDKILPQPHSNIKKSTVPKRGPKTTKTGTPRKSASSYWRKNKNRPDISRENRQLINQKSPKSPKVDEQWIKFHPEDTPFKGQTIELHHKGYGPELVEMPWQRHRGKGYYKKNHK